MDDFDKNMILQYFNASRSELEIRIKNHTQLVFHKIITTGGILSFIIYKIVINEKFYDASVNSLYFLVPIFGFFILPAVSLFYDLIISKNISNIHKFGCFVKHRIEETHFPKLKLWETYIGQRDSFFKCKNELKKHIKKQNKKLLKNGVKACSSVENLNIEANKDYSRFRIYDIDIDKMKEFRCYNNLDLKALRYYTTIILWISFFGSLIISFSLKSKVELLYIGIIEYSLSLNSIIGFIVSIFMLWIYSRTIKKYFSRFKVYILSFYDEDGIPYRTVNRDKATQKCV